MHDLPELEDAAVAGVRRAHLAEHLDRLYGPFGQFLPFIMKQLEPEVEWVTLPSGETLFESGGVADSCFIVITGRLLVAVENDVGEEKLTDTVLAGEVIGEASLLREQPRSDTVWAARDSVLARLPRHSFRLLLERSSKAIQEVSRRLARQLTHERSPRDPARTPVSSIALIPADPALQLEDLIDAVSGSLSGYGEIEVLTSESVDRSLGREGISQAGDTDPGHLRLAQWLQEREAATRCLLYRADPTWTRWTERCARQADRVAVVADADATPGLGEIEQRLSGPRQRWSLVLVHRADLDRPRDTAKWLAGSSAQAVLHVRRGHAEDQSRLARCLSGRAVGMVLGGGGARGFAQVGVMHAMRELGIPIDMIGGASIGGCIATGIAMNWGSEQLEGNLKEHWGNLIDYTLPLVSLLSGRRINRLIEQFSLDWDIEDLWRPYFCVSTNLTTSKPHKHTRGNVARAIRATCAIPGVLPPVASGREILVDGGLLDNLPIDVMRELNPFGPVIAVDVAPPQGPRAKEDWGYSVSGWRLALDRILPWRKPARAPAIAGTLMQALVVGSSDNREQMLRTGAADLYLNIHVRGVGLLEFEKVTPATEAGYRQSIEPLREWVESGALD